MKKFFLIFILSIFLPSIASTATLKGNFVYFYPTIWEIRSVGDALWEDERLSIKADGIIVNLLTGNVVAFGDVIVQRDNKKEYYDIFFTRDLNLNIYEIQPLPYVTAKEIEIDWRTTTITFKDLRVSSEITLSALSIPFGPYNSGLKFSTEEEIISIDTSAPYISIILPYNGGIFTGIFTDLGMEVSYEKEDFYLLGIRGYIDRGMSIFGEYTLYSQDKSLSLTVGYDEFPYTVIRKEFRNGIWRYILDGRVDWENRPRITISLNTEKWDKMSIKGEIIIYTENGAIEFNPYLSYRFDISQDLGLRVGLSKIGLDNVSITYKLQPAVNLKIGYVNPDKYVVGVEWGYRGIELIDCNGVVSLIIR